MNKNKLGALLGFLIISIIVLITMSCLNVQQKTNNSDIKEAFKSAQVTTADSNKSVSAPKTLIENKGRQQTNFKVEFGFNIGFLMDFQNNTQLYTNPLQQIKKDGITNLRIYEPFTKNIVNHPGSAVNLIGDLVHSNFNVLLTLSNYPDIPSIQYKKIALDDVKDADNKEAFTNRYAPVNISSYESYLSDFLNTLKEKNLIQNMSFEIGNEPDSKRFFWGNTQDFVDIAKATAGVLQNYNRPVYCCGFTSEFANNAKTDPQLQQLINSDIMDKVNLSFHFYQNKRFDINSLRLPHLNNAIITEFNFYAYQRENSTARIAYSNSPAFGSLLIQTLAFAYKNNIKKIYFFKLVDIPNKEGALGFFDKDGNPKPAYNYLVKIYDVIKDGYTMQETNQYIKLIGAQKTIVYSKVNNAPSINSMQRNAAAQNDNFKAGTWDIENN